MEEDYSQQQHAPSGGKKSGKQHNTLPLWGNEATMNLNPLILANIQGSSYFKVHLFKLKTYHEVVDEIYYQVKHMEPWERGSRKTSGQTGMCGGVRGVGAGGIVSTAYCLLYKLYTLRLTRKQVNGLLNHTDSPYIRALGFMYLRYTQPPGDLYDWYEDYLQDEEEIDVKAGGGQVMTMGQMVYQFLTKLDWFSTLFPRIPVPIQKQIEKKLEQYCRENQTTLHQLSSARPAATGGAPSAPYEESGGYEARRSGGGNGASSSREAYSGGRALPPAASGSSYRGEHDDREYGAYRPRRREGDSPAPPPEYRASSRERERESSHHHHRREKHKKKHKHKHHSRSRSKSKSRSHSHSRSRSARRRERDYERDRERSCDKERDRDRDRDYERRYR